MGSPDRIRNVASRVARWKALGHQIVVVVSAMSGETNRLLALAKNVSPNPDSRELDAMVSTGEQVSIALLAMALKDAGLKARSYTGAQVKIETDRDILSGDNIIVAKLRIGFKARGAGASTTSYNLTV